MVAPVEQKLTAAEVSCRRLIPVIQATPGGGNVQQVVGPRIGNDPAAPVSDHVVRAGVVRRLPRDVPRD